MLPGLELMAACTDMAVPGQLMQHVAQVESSHNPYAIGVVGGHLVRQPRNLAEAVSTARMLEEQGRNFSVGLVQVNRYNLAKQGLGSYEQAFDVCSNVRAGARILSDCHARAGQDWGKAFSCYYSGNFTTGYRHGYVQKVFASLARDAQATALMGRHEQAAIALAGDGRQRTARRIVPEMTERALLHAVIPSRTEAVMPQTPPVAVPVQPGMAQAAVAQPLSVQVRGQPVAVSMQPGLAQPQQGSAMPAAATPVASAPPQAAQVLPVRDSAWVF